MCLLCLLLHPCDGVIHSRRDLNVGRTLLWNRGMSLKVHLHQWGLQGSFFRARSLVCLHYQEHSCYKRPSGTSTGAKHIPVVGQVFGEAPLCIQVVVFHSMVTVMFYTFSSYNVYIIILVCSSSFISSFFANVVFFSSALAVDKQ